MAVISFNRAHKKLYGFCLFESLRDSFPAHYHNYYTVGMLLQGERKISINGENSLLSARQPVIFNPGDIHECKNTEGERNGWICLTISRSLIRETLSCSETPSFENWQLGAQREKIAKILDYFTIKQKLEDTAIPDELFILLSALKIAKKSCGIETDKDTFSSYNPVEGHIDEGIWPGLTNLVQKTGGNKYLFLRNYKKERHITPYRHFEIKRIERACQLLAEGHSPAKCAYATGFCDQSHLNRQFVKYLGYTPGIFQKAIRSVKKD